ncbi:DUF1217 domain-containing protein [uncultured Roseovarius sp.]|uniref:DUF1217 domain-containing protein n=1 Tax=uncultured Roseovarius sp. TaxID=293344 RepID=UPI00260B5467|nr:DUF1217 domain-containing protein [uncultured Roseovarius sp.]
MNFQPLVPVGGLPGWVLLNKTMERQTEVFNKSPQIVRDTDYFEQNIGKIQSAEQLVDDRRLLRVALGAFGLGEDLNSQALVKRILEEGTVSDDALANRLADERYKKFTDAFGFGELALPRTQLAGFGREITDKFRELEFEVAVGEQDESLRLAMNAQRELADIVTGDESDNAKWFAIMGNPPLRKVFEVALGLPSSFGQIDIDRQLETFKTQASRQLGIESLADLASEDTNEEFIRRYLLRDQIASFQFQSSNSIALTLLQSAPNYFRDA